MGLRRGRARLGVVEHVRHGGDLGGRLDLRARLVPVGDGEEPALAGQRRDHGVHAQPEAARPEGLQLEQRVLQPGDAPQLRRRAADGRGAR